MHLRAITSRLRNESGQAAVEFALVLPLLIAFVFLIAGFARVFNAYNDLNQMAADGARFAAVGTFPGTSALLWPCWSTIMMFSAYSPLRSRIVQYNWSDDGARSLTD